MDTLHNAFVKQLERVVPTMATEVIAAKLTKQGVKLSSKEKERVINGFMDGVAKDRTTVALRLRKWQFWDRNEVSLEFTPQELHELEERSAIFEKELPDLTMSLVNDVSEMALGYLQGSWPREERRELKALKPFYRSLRRRWHRPFQLLSMLISFATQMGETLNNALRTGSLDDESNLIETETRLHARASQVASGVLCLLRQGFADGAIARWRTLHEIAVVATFIQENGEDLALRYVRHQAVEVYRAAINYQAHCEQLGDPPVDAEELDRLRKSYQEVIKEYGPDFAAKYGWAAATLRNSKPTFADVEQAVGLEHLRPYYKMASYDVHAEPRGAFFRLGLASETDMLISGPTDFGFAEPGRNTAHSLVVATSALVMLLPTMDSLVALQTMIKLSRDAGEAFVQTQFELETDRIGVEVGGSIANAS